MTVRHPPANQVQSSRRGAESGSASGPFKKACRVGPARFLSPSPAIPLPPAPVAGCPLLRNLDRLKFVRNPAVPIVTSVTLKQVFQSKPVVIGHLTDRRGSLRIHVGRIRILRASIGLNDRQVRSLFCQ